MSYQAPTGNPGACKTCGSRGVRHGNHNCPRCERGRRITEDREAARLEAEETARGDYGRIARAESR